LEVDIAVGSVAHTMDAAVRATLLLLAGLARKIAALAVAVVVAWLAGAVLGPRAAVAAGAALVLGSGLVWVVLPRLAHRSFRGGAFTRASVAYRVLRLVRLDAGARASLEVSVAACMLGAERYVDGLRLLGRIDPARLGESSRAAWLNDRSYALARSGGDAAQALADIDEAIALRPDLDGFRHTRGLALLQLGRVDEAIRELEEVWRRGQAEDAPPLLEAERCYDLGRAWTLRGEPDYAGDYFERARRAAPGSLWAARASSELKPRQELPSVLSELV
jgi:tetratricopeptide (TPR) repeat protein